MSISLINTPCGALLFPIEVKPYLSPELYEKYNVAFNKIYERRQAAEMEGYNLTVIFVDPTPPAIGGAGTGTMGGGRRKTRGNARTRARITQKRKVAAA